MQRRVFAVLLLCGFATAQTKSSKATNTTPRSSHPIFKINLSEDSDFGSMPWAKDWPASPQGYCNGDGSLYVWRWPPGQGLAAFTPKGIVTFLSDKLNDIPTPYVRHGFVSRSGLYLVADSIENPKQETKIVDDTEGHEIKLSKTAGEQHQYITRFDKDGSYKGRIKLDLSLFVYSLAAFDSGTLVAQGLDENQIPRVALLDSSGQLIRYLELSKDLSAVSEIPPKEIKVGKGQTSSVGAITMLSSFTSSVNGILFVRSLSSNRVYEIQESGQVRAVDLKPPEGYEVEGFVATDRNWLVRFRKPKPNAAWSDAEHSLFAVDPQNGDLVTEYRVAPPDTGVSCFYDGSFWAVRRKDEKLIVVRGIAEP